MTALGGLDGGGRTAGGGVVTARPRARRRADSVFTDALSGPDGMADPGPWPTDLRGTTAGDELFGDALSVAGTSARTSTGSPTTGPPTTAGAPGPGAPRVPPAPAPAAARRSPPPARREPQRPRPVSAASTPVRATPLPSGTGWSSGGTTARDLLRQAREAGGLAVAASPFLRPGGQQPVASTPARPTPPAGRQSGSRATTSQWASPAGRTRARRPSTVSPSATTGRRRLRSSTVFTLVVLAVLLLFASGVASSVVDLVRSLLDR